MSGKRTLPGALVALIFGLVGGVTVGTVGEALAMPWWVVWFGLYPLAIAAGWLAMGILWRLGRLR